AWPRGSARRLPTDGAPLRRRIAGWRWADRCGGGKSGRPPPPARTAPWYFLARPPAPHPMHSFDTTNPTAPDAGAARAGRGGGGGAPGGGGGARGPAANAASPPAASTRARTTIGAVFIRFNVHVTLRPQSALSAGFHQRKVNPWLMRRIQMCGVEHFSNP